MSTRRTERRLRVVILNQYGLPMGSPGITRHGDIGAELVQRGHDVTVIASSFDYLTRRPRRVEKDQSQQDRVKFIWLRSGAYSGNDSRRIRSMMHYSATALLAVVRIQPRPDVVVGSSPHLLTGLSASIAARLIRRPWVFEVRDFWPSALVDLGAIKRGRMVHCVLERIERHLYANASAVVTVPPNGGLRLEEVGVDSQRIVHIPNAATAVADRTTSESPQRRWRDDDFILMYAGAHGVANQLVNVVEAATILRATRPEKYRRVRIELMGDGQQRTLLSALVEERGLDRVRIRGPRAKDEIPELLDGADACLVHLAPADVFRYGLSPNKLFDYFAAGKPVLISSEYPTIVDEAGAGIRFPPGDPSAMADAIIQMMDTPPEERAEMGRRGLELVRTRYSINAITDQYEALLQEVVRTHRT